MSTSNRQDRSVEIAVIGGGVSGLTCGFWLKQAGRSVAVLEGTARAGGSIRTLARDGWIFEQGPNTITDAGGDVARLCDALGIASRIREASPEAKRRYIYRASGTQGADGNRGRLVPLPTSPPAFLASPLLPFGAKFGLLREPFIPPRRDAGEESVADFVRRRLGQPYLDTLVGPFVSGVYAGDPEKLSVRWAVKVIHGLEQEHGSLIRGALARRKGPAPGGRLVSFPEGLEELPRALARSLGTDLYLNAEVTGLAQANGGFLLETKEQGGIGRLRAERVILAAPADAASRLLSALGPSERCDLAGIPYAPVVSVALGFRDQNLGARLKGFGFLVPRVENLTILGCLFSSSLFEGRAPEGCVALTVLVGGATQPEILQMDEAALLAMVLRDLRKALGALPDPIFRHVTRWPRAIPQYNLGHGRFVEAARSLEEAFPGIHVGGNLLEGVSLADCIRNARSLAASIVAEKDMTVEATAGNE